MKDFLSKINFMLLAALALVAKLVVLGGNLADSGAIFAICVFLSVKLYLDVKRDNLLDKANQQIAAMAKEFGLIKNEISTLKMKANMESTTRKLGNAQRRSQDPERRF